MHTKALLILSLLLCGALASDCDFCDSAWGPGTSCYDKPMYCASELYQPWQDCEDAAGVAYSAAQDACEESACYETAYQTYRSDKAACQKAYDDACIVKQAEWCRNKYAECKADCVPSDCATMVQCGNICTERTGKDCSGAVVISESDDRFIDSCGCLCGEEYKEYGNLHVAVDCNAVKRGPAATPVADEEICDNNVDDDQDGKTDCFDTKDCSCSEDASITITSLGEDGKQHPVVGIYAFMKYGNGKVANSTTDSAGKAAMQLPGIWESDGKIRMEIVFADGSKTFTIWNPDSTAYTLKPEFTVEKEEDLRQTYAMTGQDAMVARIWARSQQAAAFYKNKLGFNPLPKKEDIVVLGKQCPACHLTSNDYLTDYGTYFGPAFFSKGIAATESPQNGEWHEFNHHAMFVAYGGMWDSGRIQNHLGWPNPRSDDSYIEGFAEFMSLLQTDYYADQYPRLQSGVYNWASTASYLEANFDIKKWPEEFAIASILWDIYDPVAAYANVDKDHIQVSEATIWTVLSTQHKFSDGQTRFIHNTRDIYEAFKALPDAQLTKVYTDEYPSLHDGWMDNATALQKIFLTHGAFWDKSGTGTWDGSDDTIGYTPMNGDNSTRRRDIELPPGSFVKADIRDQDGNAVTSSETTVSVKHSAPYEYLDFTYTGAIKDGLIPVAPPSYNVEYTLEVRLSGTGIAQATPMTITSQEYTASYDADKQYFATKTASVVHTTETEDNRIPEGDEGAGAGIMVLGGLGLVAVLGIGLFVLVAAVVAAFFLLRKKG